MGNAESQNQNNNQVTEGLEIERMSKRSSISQRIEDVEEAHANTGTEKTPRGNVPAMPIEVDPNADWNHSLLSQIARAQRAGLAQFLFVMEQYIDNPAAQCACCKHLGERITSRSTHAVMIDAGVGRLLSRAMERHSNNGDVQQYACWVFLRLSYNEDATTKSRLSSGGAIELIVSALEHHSESLHVSINASGALRNLLVGCEENCNKFSRMQKLGVLLEVLKLHLEYQNIQITIISILGVLSSYENGRQTIMQGPTVDCVLRTMKKYSSSVIIQEFSARVIANICVETRFLSKLSEKMVIIDLINAMNDHFSEPSTALAICRAIAHLLVYVPNHTVLLDNNGLEIIMSCLSFHVTQSRANVVEKAILCLYFLLLSDTTREHHALVDIKTEFNKLCQVIHTEIIECAIRTGRQGMNHIDKSDHQVSNIEQMVEKILEFSKSI